MINHYAIQGGYASQAGNINGNAATATLATRSTNLAGGGTNTVPYQSAANTTAMLAANSTGTTKYLSQVSSGTPAWAQPAMANISDYSSGTWTPIDSSGAGLTLTVSNAYYVQIGKSVTCWFKIQYPSTADGTNAVIGGLPFAIVVPASNNTFAMQANAANKATAGLLTNGVTTFGLYDATLSAVTNATSSTVVYYGIVKYQKS